MVLVVLQIFEMLAWPMLAAWVQSYCWAFAWEPGVLRLYWRSTFAVWVELIVRLVVLSPAALAAWLV
jgi:hypothetical protein